MAVRQICDACGKDGLFIAGPVRVTGSRRSLGTRVVQCPDCQRFFCLEHCEAIPVEPGAREARLCCPLDLGTPLGSPEEEETLLAGDEPSSGKR
jgi:hypothetical protein